jgi:MFS family permease
MGSSVGSPRIPSAGRSRTGVRLAPGMLESRRDRGLVLIAIGLAGLSFAVMQSLVIPVLPLIRDEFGTSTGAVTWVLTGNLLSAAIATPILGRVGDLHGKKWVLVATLAVLLLGTLLAAVATTLPVLIVGRVVQGVGGGLFPLAFGIVRDRFPEDRVPGAIGMISSTLAFGGGLGVVLAGPIVQHLSYHWLFWIPCPLIAMAVVSIAVIIPHESGRRGGRINWLGALALSGWMTALLLGLTEGPRLGWGSASVVGLFAGFLLMLGLWIWLEHRAVTPLIDLHMLIRPAVWRFNVVAFLFGTVLYSSFRVVPELLQTPRSAGYGFGATVAESGLYLLPQTICAFLLGLMAGPIERRIGSARAVVLGSLIGASSMLLLAVAHSASWQVLVASTLSGIGTGLTYAAIPAVIVDAVPADQTGAATGVNTNVRTIGGAVGSQLTAAILTAGVALGVVPADARFVVVFAVLAALSLLAVIVGLTGLRRSVTRS